MIHIVNNIGNIDKIFHIMIVFLISKISFEIKNKNVDISDGTMYNNGIFLFSFIVANGIIDVIKYINNIIIKNSQVTI